MMTIKFIIADQCFIGKQNTRWDTFESEKEKKRNSPILEPRLSGTHAYIELNLRIFWRWLLSRWVKEKRRRLRGMKIFSFCPLFCFISLSHSLQRTEEEGQRWWRIKVTVLIHHHYILKQLKSSIVMIRWQSYCNLYAATYWGVNSVRKSPLTFPMGPKLSIIFIFIIIFTISHHLFPIIHLLSSQASSSSSSSPIHQILHLHLHRNDNHSFCNWLKVFTLPYCISHNNPGL